MSPEKPNVGKPVQLSEGFLIKQYQSTIWVPKLAYPTNNFLGSNTSQFLTNLLAKTSDNPSGSYSAPICPRNPSVCPFWTASAPLCPTLALRHPKWVCVNLLALCVNNAGLSEALRSSQLPLHGPVWALATTASLSSATVLLSQHYLCLSISLYSNSPQLHLPITNSISLSKPHSRE